MTLQPLQDDRHLEHGVAGPDAASRSGSEWQVMESAYRCLAVLRESPRRELVRCMPEYGVVLHSVHEGDDRCPGGDADVANPVVALRETVDHPERRIEPQGLV